MGGTLAAIEKRIHPETRFRTRRISYQRAVEEGEEIVVGREQISD